MSTLKAAVISDELDNTLTMSNVIQGSAKVLMKLDADAAPPTIIFGLNMSSVVDGGFGIITMNFTNSFSSINYVPQFTGRITSGFPHKFGTSQLVDPTVNQLVYDSIGNTDLLSSNIDPLETFATIDGDLA